MNLIYTCIFHEPGYINLLKLLINSIAAKSHINNENTHILLITSPNFKPIMEQQFKIFSNLKIFYHTIEIRGMTEALCARLNIFEFINVDNYEKILYLDTDIIVHGDINNVFNLQTLTNKIYASPDGVISGPYHGCDLFDFSKIDPNTPSFISGVMYFHNSPEIKELFRVTREHIHQHIYMERKPIPCCVDQAFINYNTIIRNMYDIELLTPYIYNCALGLIPDSKTVIYHFPGGIGISEPKFKRMMDFWNNTVSYIVLPTENYSVFNMANRTYTWENLYITFLEKGKMNAFGVGNYTHINPYEFLTEFGGHPYRLIFNEDYSKFTSYDDDEKVMNGVLV